MGRPENIPIQTKGDYKLMRTPAGRYSIYKDIGHRDEFIKGKLKSEGDKPDGTPFIKEWEAVDVLIKYEDSGSESISLDEVINQQDQISYIQSSGTANIEKQMLEKAAGRARPSSIDSRVYQETRSEFPEPPRSMEVTDDEYIPTPTSTPLPIPQDNMSWAAQSSGVNPLQQRRFREVVGKSPTQRDWGRY